VSFLKKHWRALAFGALFVALAIGIGRFLVAPPSSLPREADARAAARVEPRPEPDARRAIARPEGDWVGGLGIVEPAAEPTSLSPTVAGRIAAIHVEEGDVVEPGQVLV
jgi:multidrug efflux pump subunit AcrA (membrane-fusion protein)